MALFRTALLLAIAATLTPTAEAQRGGATPITATTLGSFQPQTLRIHLDYAESVGDDGLVAATVIVRAPKGTLEVDRLILSATAGDQTHQVVVNHEEQWWGLVGQGRLPPLESTEAFGLMSDRRTGVHIGIPVRLEGAFAGSTHGDGWMLEIEGIHLENEGWEIFLTMETD